MGSMKNWLQWVENNASVGESVYVRCVWGLMIDDLAWQRLEAEVSVDVCNFVGIQMFETEENKQY